MLHPLSVMSDVADSSTVVFRGHLVLVTDTDDDDGGACWPHGQCARRAIAETMFAKVGHRMGGHNFRDSPCFGRPATLVPAAFAVINSNSIPKGG
jgi:hypothetical protein